MLIKPFSQIIDPAKIFNVQNSQYSERIVMQDSVPANSSKMCQVSVSNLGHFFSMFITGSFTALGSPAGAVVDTGINYLSGQLLDGAGNRKLFNERIPFHLWLSPGRRRDAASTTVLTDPVSNNLFYPLEFEYLFTANSTILLDVVNTSDEENSFEIMFHGIRIISGLAFDSQGRRTASEVVQAQRSAMRTGSYRRRGV